MNSGIIQKFKNSRIQKFKKSILHVRTKIQFRFSGNKIQKIFCGILCFSVLVAKKIKD